MTEAANEFVANMIDRSVFTPNELALCNRIQELEADLAQKTRECEELVKELEAANNEFGSETSHWPKLWERIAELKSLSNQRQAQVEQLERQVAELSKARIQPKGTKICNGCGGLLRQGMGHRCPGPPSKRN